MFDLSKIFDLSKKFALPDTFLKSKNYCTRQGKLRRDEYVAVLSVFIYLASCVPLQKSHVHCCVIHWLLIAYFAATEQTLCNVNIYLTMCIYSPCFFNICIPDLLCTLLRYIPNSVRTSVFKRQLLVLFLNLLKSTGQYQDKKTDFSLKYFSCCVFHLILIFLK